MYPILFKFHSLTVYSYGFFVALGMLVVFYLSLKRAPRFGLAADTVSDLVFVTFVAGVIGARFFYVWQHFDEYSPDLLRALSVQEGGLVWYGGFIFAVSSGLIYASAKRLSIPTLLDFFSPLIPLAHAIGRVGCFMNGCCFGKTTQSVFGVVLPQEVPGRFPVQLYEGAFLFILSGFLFALSSKGTRNGRIFLIYVAFYSAARFLLEFFRGDQLPTLSLTIPQWSSLFLFAGAVIFLIRKPR